MVMAISPSRDLGIDGILLMILLPPKRFVKGEAAE